MHLRSALKAFGAALIICTPALAQPADDGNGDSEAINLICTGRGEKLASGYTSSLE